MSRALHLLVAWLFGLALLGPAPAAAHEMSMAEVELRQARSGEFLWQWIAGNRAGESRLRLVWPAGCADDAGVLRCGPQGLSGKLSVEGLGKGFSAVLVKVYWLDGQMRVYTLTKAQPVVTLFGSAEDQRGMGEIAWAYGLLGVEHILSGVDHLLFVVSLLFLVGFRRQLVWTITAFTVAHSLTLGLAALGWLVLRSPPVEATIALSIVLVAGEALHREQTLSRRWPAAVAFLFGLVHGLGFAGALQAIGLPEQHLLLALLTFNVGVELGQLGVVVLAFVVARLLATWPAFARLRTPALYGIGGVAAYWSWSRIAAIFV
jgi:hydrogenase/urease accessory protein HupE